MSLLRVPMLHTRDTAGRQQPLKLDWKHNSVRLEQHVLRTTYTFHKKCTARIVSMAVSVPSPRSSLQDSTIGQDIAETKEGTEDDWHC